MISHRRTYFALIGLILSFGAPLGWLLLRFFQGVSPFVEIHNEPVLLGYLLFSTMIVFVGFGLLLGRQLDQIHKINRALESLSITDSLTGLKNRRYFHARLEEECARAKRNGACFALMIMDIDHFKRLNDTYGHPFGDKVLQELAQSIAGTVRATDSFCRIGGEEFGVLLTECDANSAQLLAARILDVVRALRVPLEPGEAKDDETYVSVTISIGVAYASQLETPTPTTMYSQADQALYQAKAQGRDRLVSASNEMLS